MIIARAGLLVSVVQTLILINIYIFLMKYGT